jgi:CHAD domain-containing protein
MIAGPHPTLDLADARPARALEHARRHLQALASAALRVRSGRDGQAIHDLRVATRRLSSTLDAWTHAFDPDAARDARRCLRSLRRQLGRAREREVLAEQLAVLLVGEPLAIREAAILELQRLERRVDGDRERARRAVRPARVERLRLRLERCLATLAPESDDLLSAARARTELRRAAAMDALARGSDGDDEALHRARIAVKRWRYQVEATAGDGEGTRLTELRALQQCLGDLHDAVVLRDFISVRASRARAKGRVAHAEALSRLREKADQARWRALEGLPAASAGLVPSA